MQLLTMLSIPTHTVVKLTEEYPGGGGTVIESWIPRVSVSEFCTDRAQECEQEGGRVVSIEEGNLFMFSPPWHFNEEFTPPYIYPESPTPTEPPAQEFHLQIDWNQGGGPAFIWAVCDSEVITNVPGLVNGYAHTFEEATRQAIAFFEAHNWEDIIQTTREAMAQWQKPAFTWEELDAFNAELIACGCLYPMDAKDRAIAEELCRVHFAKSMSCLVGGSCVVSPRRYWEIRIAEWGEEKARELCNIPDSFFGPTPAPVTRGRRRYGAENYHEGL